VCVCVCVWGGGDRAGFSEAHHSAFFWCLLYRMGDVGSRWRGFGKVGGGCAKDIGPKATHVVNDRAGFSEANHSAFFLCVKTKGGGQRGRGAVLGAQ
jgi:hypothetical protein